MREALDILLEVQADNEAFQRILRGANRTALYQPTVEPMNEPPNAPANVPANAPRNTRTIEPMHSFGNTLQTNIESLTNYIQQRQAQRNDQIDR